MHATRKDQKSKQGYKGGSKLSHLAGYEVRKSLLKEKNIISTSIHNPVNVTCMNRRRFLKTAGTAATASVFGLPHLYSQSPVSPTIYKAVKVTMIKEPLSIDDKFRISREVGFDGISLMAPGWFEVRDVLRAQDRTGLRVHNVNGANHWKVRLSDPDPAIRMRAVQDLHDTMQFAADTGADSVLLVVGKVTDPEKENHDQVWERSTQAIHKSIPLAAKLGVRILLENVGNGFCETPELWNQYIDQFQSPWVGAFFDIGNHHSRGGAHVWCRSLGHRIVKLDVKGHHSGRRKNCDLFQGNINWEKVRTEIRRIGFSGWATAEVSGGDQARLRQVAQRMDQALGL